MIGGMVVQIMIQAAILRAILMLIAKHEADTSFAKVAMVTAGISVGSFAIGVFTMQQGPFITIPAQIVFMAAILMTFCWISIGKSLIVVAIYITCHFLIAFLMALLLGAMFAGMMPSQQAATPALLPSEPLPAPEYMPDNSSAPAPVYQAPEPEQAAARANMLKEKSEAKKREIEARVREMEEGPSIPAGRPETASPVKHQAPVPSRPTAIKTAPISPIVKSEDSGWDAARKSLRIGGRMADGEGYVIMINGKMFQKGDTVTHNMGGIRYKWKILSISKDKLEMEPVNATPAP